MIRPVQRLVALALVLGAASCSAPNGADAGAPDSGPDASVDAGVPDAGGDAGVVDAGPRDASDRDASVADAGDGGHRDAGLDAGADAGPDAGADGTDCSMSTGLSGVLCAGLCVDTRSDSINCGACNAPCLAQTFCHPGPTPTSSPSCVPVPTCGLSDSGVLCPLTPHLVGQCCSGSCVDPRADSANCGACGQACPLGELCGLNGDIPQCLLVDGGWGPGCMGQPGACPAGTACFLPGTYGLCLATQCVAGNGVACSFGPTHEGTCCGGECVDLAQSPNDCGGCGLACGSGVCFSSTAFPPGTCLPSGPPGCGACGPGRVCVGAACLPTICSGPDGACALGSDAGACCSHDYGFTWSCQDLNRDPTHCGGCGNLCPASQQCLGGVCSGAQAPCGAGTVSGYCSLDAGTDVCCPGRGCIEVGADPQNCGDCDVWCRPDAGCVAGRCG